MSNSYLQFSEALVLKSPEEKSWFERYMDAAHPAVSKHWGRDAGIFVPLTVEAEFWMGVFDETQEEAVCFEYRFTELEGKSCVVFYSEDHAILDHVATFVQHFFKEMRPEGKDGFSISWAETCDKPLPGQFGGGACLITKDEIHWLNTWQWITDLCEHLKVGSE